MSNAFDILRKLPDGGIVWIETARSLEVARQRFKIFADYKPGEYVIFSQERQCVIAMPWVPFARETIRQENSRTRDKVAKGANAEKKSVAQFPSVCANERKPVEIIAAIVADISQALRHKP
jgi:hypothetical protein